MPPVPLAHRLHRLFIAAAATVGAVVTVAACSGGSAQRTLRTVTTRRAPAATSTLAPTTSTTVAAPSTSVTSPPAVQATPQDQAKAFYDAWSKGDRTAATALGEPAAVAAIFARPWSAADGWTFSECSGAAGSAICAWQGGPGQLQMLVRGATGGLAVTVVDVKFT